MMKWQPIESAPLETRILATDGKWDAVVIVSGPPDYDQRRTRIDHPAVCQEYDWEPTHWAPYRDNE